MSNFEESKLKSKLRQHLSELEVVRSEIAAKQNLAITLQATVDRIKNQIELLSRKKNHSLHISDHAFVRYFERVLGYDLKFMENEILTEQVRSSVALLGGNGEFRVQNHCLIVQNNCVVTVTNRKK